MIRLSSTRLSSFKQQILSLLYPPKCVYCGVARPSYFCEPCRTALTRISNPFCQKCGYPLETGVHACRQCQIHPISYLNTIRSLAFFEGTSLRPAIHQFKYQNLRALAEDFAILLQECYLAHQMDTDVIVPVPLYRSRLRERGYNQSALLAKSLSGLIKQPVDTESLVRQRDTKSQMSLNAAERQENVAGAFCCLSDRLRQQTVLLVDDVCTTGATLNACAQALKQMNVRAVHGLTLARAR